MKDSLNSLLEIVKKNVAVCEWCNTQTSDMHLVKLKEEITELELAIKNNDLENAKEEMGDVIWDALILAYIFEREAKFKAKDSVDNVIRKIYNRKPWLLKGEKVSREEAVRIWVEAKAKEKMEKVNQKEK
ncbi:MAG: MazG nucleotide pyrophosphohydrolase domain-containing protein [Candidatus Micrarchaeota archaeon]